MTTEPAAEARPGPLLLCAGTDAPAAAGLAELAASLLRCDRPAIVLATWAPPPISAPLDAIMDAFYDLHADLRAAAHRAAGDAAEAAVEVLRAHGFDAAARLVSDERAPWRVILEQADELGAAAIVAGAGDPPATRPGSLGRQARALAHRSHRPLLVIPAGAGPAAAGAPAVFAYDGSAPADRALAAAPGLLRRRPALVATAWMPASYAVGVALVAIPDEIAQTGGQRLDEAARRHAADDARAGASALAKDGWPCEHLTLESAHSVPGAIIAAADERDAAVLVTGTRGRSRIAAALLGSNAEGILRHAGRPVLLVPEPPA